MVERRRHRCSSVLRTQAGQVDVHPVELGPLLTAGDEPQSELGGIPRDEQPVGVFHDWPAEQAGPNLATAARSLAAHATDRSSRGTAPPYGATGRTERKATTGSP